ncbi:MAG: CHASE2 domain-containing protein [Prevotella sp.]|nr:CHASE2 domain-containing protein [Prevotella sp.]
MASSGEKRNKRTFLSFDHLVVCLMIAILGKALLFITGVVSIFDPMKAAFDDFHITDVFFEIRQSASSSYDDDIVIVDMTNLRTRDSIARVITDIKSCKPKILGVDLIFQRANFNNPMDDVDLVSALTTGDCQQVLSCKLRDYSQKTKSFQNCLYSFFRDDVEKLNWGYTNYLQTRMGGVTRETSQFQLLGDSVFFSFPYLLACQYAGKPLVAETVNERLIMYDNVKFHVMKSHEVLQNANRLKGKLVLLGTTEEESDMHFTPIGKKPGIEVIAYSILSYMKHDEITRWSQLTCLLIAFACCFLVAWMGYVIVESHHFIFSAILLKLFNFSLMVLLIGMAFCLFIERDTFVDLFYPLLGLALVESVRGIYVGIIRWLEKRFEKKKKPLWPFVAKSLYAKSNKGSNESSSQDNSKNEHEKCVTKVDGGV